MDFLGPYAWLIVILGGAIVLGLAIAFGMKRSGNLTPREAAIRDSGTKAEYRAEEAERKQEEPTTRP